MRNFRCAYNDQDQFVFYETATDYTAGGWAIVFGFIAGFIAGLFMIAVNDPFAALFFALVIGYFVMRLAAVTFRFDPLGSLILVSLFILGGGFLYWLHYSLYSYWGMDIWHSLGFYTICLAGVSPCVYFYAQLAFIADKRKHQLRLVRRPRVTVSHGRRGVTDFVIWIYRFITFADKFSFFPPPSPSRTAEAIQVRNDTLKRIKVILYHPSDYCCWVPAGGIGGPSVGFVLPGEEKGFDPPANVDNFKLKVFTPGFIDHELGYAAAAHRGDTWAVMDVHRKIVPFVPAEVPQTFEGPPRESHGRMRRNPSSFSKLPESPVDSPPRRVLDPDAMPDEVLVRNECVLPLDITFFDEVSNSFLWPKGVTEVAGLRRILPRAWGRFRLLDELRVCMRVTFATREVDYCIVSGGNRYLVSDGLID